jgi:lipoprotein-anchoring transpeptidase ErfK/SrfK
VFSGRWIDVDLNEPSLLTAYEGDQPVFSALAITGRTLTETLEGTYHIIRRVEDETMDSETLGVPHDDPQGYYLEGVLYTQYFTDDGASIHYNYWSSNFGEPGSHGCLGLREEDAAWLWDWASIGTVVNIHS